MVKITLKKNINIQIVENMMVTNNIEIVEKIKNTRKKNRQWKTEILEANIYTEKKWKKCKGKTIYKQWKKYTQREKNIQWEKQWQKERYLKKYRGGKKYS